MARVSDFFAVTTRRHGGVVLLDLKKAGKLRAGSVGHRDCKRHGAHLLATAKSFLRAKVPSREGQAELASALSERAEGVLLGGAFAFRRALRRREDVWARFALVMTAQARGGRRIARAFNECLRQASLDSAYKCCEECVLQFLWIFFIARSSFE